MCNLKNTKVAANIRIGLLILILALLSSSVAFAQKKGCSKKLSSLLDVRMTSITFGGRSVVDEKIRTCFERRLAVMVTDLSGMTAYTKERGIYEMLELIRRMHLISRPLAEATEAELVKTFSDDMMFVHASAESLFILAKSLIRANALASLEGAPIHMGIGMSFGDVLYLKGEDVWGDPVNVASKLGEDVAGPGEILLSHAIWVQLQEEGADLSNCRFSRSDGICGFAHWVCSAAF